MTPIAPALELVGDWTSARLLVRLMYAIDSPWELGDKGFVHSETGEICAVTMRQADPKVAAAIHAGEHPVHPSFTDDVLGAVDAHHAVLRVTPDPSLKGDAALAAAVRCADGLVNAGAIAVWCPASGAAHAADRWQVLAAELDAATDDALRREVLYRMVVRPLVAAPERWHTDGMGLIGGPDVACSRDIPDAIALELLASVVQSVVLGRPPADGRELRAPGRSDVFVVAREPDGRRKKDPAHNPFGTIVLSAR